ncbi:MAG: radical SAM protein [Candidatus Woesebacteria bacterium]
MQTAVNSALRVRVTPMCNMSCVFCHEEGGDRSALLSTSQTTELAEFAREHSFTKFHLTGGEPTLHPELSSLVRVISDAGFPCNLTTNGQFRSTLLWRLRDACVGSMNFSIHTVDPAAWSKLQHRGSLRVAEMQIARASTNIQEAVLLGIKTKVNIVVGDNPTLAVGVVEHFRNSGVDFRLLNVLGSEQSLASIDQVLKHYSAKVVAETQILGSSQFRTSYSSSVGDLVVKQIRDYREPSVCAGCKTKCDEGFYGVRIVPMQGRLYARLCLHHTSESTLLPLAVFRRSPQLAAIKKQSGLI